MSYTSFEYSWVRQPVVAKDSISFSVKIKNTGKYNADEVVQVYINYPQFTGMPARELKAFKRISTNINEEVIANFNIPLSELQKWDIEKHAWNLYNGNYKIIIGSNAEEMRLTADVKLK